MTVERISVIGAGLMGHGIAQVCAQAGYQVVMRDLSEELVNKGLERIRKFLSDGVHKGKVSQADADSTLGRILATTSLEEAARDTDLIIEAIVEDMEQKKQLFRELDRLCAPHVIFASNTSYLSITEMAAVTGRPDRFIGMHWFNPPQLMRLIEIPRGQDTSEETVATIVELAKRLGKVPAVCSDSPGFIVNRLLQPFYNEAMSLLEEGVASAQDIDTALKAGGGFRMGPLELRDFVGLDTALRGTEVIYNALRHDKFKPRQCLIRLVKAGHYGRKTGRGFYTYGQE
ncbi:MAG TPA: 3-hydroxyacyl-CoA dehydrogenase family protein [Dehalococcoidia bacterium]|nr:3-hydroxyacyl-CoA dehydrogenase family protein [Dehalococcoidia bacterium]